MTDHVPSLLILVPGPFRQPGEVVSILSRHEVDATVAGGAPFAAGSVEIDIVEDPGLGVSVARSCTELPAGLRASLEGASRAALVEIGRRLDEDLATLATVGRTLREMGGLAVRMERSGHAMDWTTWISRVEGNDPRSLLALGTLLCRDDDGQTFTCGMHHFDLPDAEVALDDPAEAAYWLEALSLYQIVESPTLTSGHTFQPDERSPRRVLERWPDHRHVRDDGRFNPFGIWRALPPGREGLEPLRMAPTFMPSLSAILFAAERSAGRPLRREELEMVVDGAVCMTLDVARALQLERARGYADIEPRLAWEQWQIARQTY